jgi:hypothetical protein
MSSVYTRKQTWRSLHTGVFLNLKKSTFYWDFKNPDKNKKTHLDKTGSVRRT